MQTTGDLILAIGQLHGRVAALERATTREVIALRRELITHVMLIHRKLKNGGHKARVPWLNIIAMAVTGGTSLLGLLKPETAAAILRGLLH